MSISQEEIALNECKEEFKEACNKIIDKSRLKKGIGTLREKTTHAVIKNYIVPIEKYHEIPCGRYVADILYEGEIIEIQTANFNMLRKKLEAFLQTYEVTVVYPIPSTKWLLWIDEKTGEISKKRKSPKTGNFNLAFKELYKIKNFLDNPHLHFRFLLIDMEEYRIRNGWSQDGKKGSTRYDRIPIALVEELKIANRNDYIQFIPENLPEKFISKDYAKTAKISETQAQKALLVLTYLDAVKRIGKQGRSILYERIRKTNETINREN